jgi:hypothetical protein
MAIARYYDASKNPDGAVLDGVPLRDLTEEEFAELPPWLQASVDAAPFYRKTKPRHPSEAEPETQAEVQPAPEPTTTIAEDPSPRRRRE